MARDSFVFYKSFYDAIKKIPEEYQLELYNAILSYSLEGIEPNNLSPVAEAMFILIKPNIDSSQKRYEASVENGKKGGRPKKNTQEKPNQNPKEIQEEPNQNLNDNEDDDEDDNDLKKNNKKKKYGENGNVKFTDEEYEKVKAYFPKDYTERIQALDDYIQSKGKKYKDFFATLKTWARKEGYKPPDTKTEELKEIDTSDLTPEEYRLLMQKKITIEELIEKGRVHVG